MRASRTITRRQWFKQAAIAAAGVAATRGAGAQTDATVARADTLVATGQPSGGAPTFAQYNDFNPFHPGLDLRSSICFVLEPLFFYSVLPDRMVPWLAESYEYNADHTAITVHLRRGVSCNDGYPFSADDVIYTIDMLRKNGQGKGDQLYASAMARDVKDLVHVDDHTVRIELTHPDPRWFFTYLTVRFTEGSFILPRHIYSAVDPANLASFTALDKVGPNGPVGTGAFKITSMMPERIASTGFHKLPEMKRVIFVPFTTHEQAAQLISNGEVDTILEGHVPVMKSLLQRFPDHNHHVQRQQAALRQYRLVADLALVQPHQETVPGRAHPPRRQPLPQPQAGDGLCLPRRGRGFRAALSPLSAADPLFHRHGRYDQEAAHPRL